MPNPIGHFEIGVVDINAACEFYSKLFGWEIKPYEDGTYALVFPGEGIIGGLNLISGDMPPYVSVYANVENIDEILGKAIKKGAVTIVGRTEIEGDKGYYAMFCDPDLNPIGLWSQE